MDPKTRRNLWNILNIIRNSGKLLVLSTHSMDEIEALSTKLGIIIKGELKCIGNIQDIKSNYGNGFTLLVKITLNAEQNELIKRFSSFILKKYKYVELKENRDGFLNFHLKENSFNLFSNIFELMEEQKERFSIEYFTITQTNLEQIFLNFHQAKLL